MQRYYCHRCGKTFSESQPLEGLRIQDDKSAQIVHLLCEGVGIRAISRLTGIHKTTVLHVLRVAGEHCASLLSERLQGFYPTHVEIDEIWTFVLNRERGRRDPISGDQFCWLSIDQPTKLILNYQISKRTKNAADHFLDALARRVAPDAHFNLSSDGLPHYRYQGGSVFKAFGSRVNYGTEVKTYGNPGADNGEGQKITRYLPMVCKKCERKVEYGERDTKSITVNHLERQNLSLRLFNRRFTRLTLGYSRKFSNLDFSVAITVAFHNFCRVHSTIKQTPAQAAGLTDHVWSKNGTADGRIETMSADLKKTRAVFIIGDERWTVVALTTLQFEKAFLVIDKGDQSKGQTGQVYPLELSQLMPSQAEGIDYECAVPLVIPMEAAGLRDERRGFFRIA